MVDEDGWLATSWRWITFPFNLLWRFVRFILILTGMRPPPEPDWVFKPSPLGGPAQYINGVGVGADEELLENEDEDEGMDGKTLGPNPRGKSHKKPTTEELALLVQSEDLADIFFAMQHVLQEDLTLGRKGGDALIKAVAEYDGGAAVQCCVSRFLSGFEAESRWTTAGYVSEGYGNLMRFRSADALCVFTRVKSIGKKVLAADPNVLAAFCGLVDHRSTVPSMRAAAFGQGLSALGNLATVGRRVRDEIRELNPLTSLVAYVNDRGLLEGTDKTFLPHLCSNAINILCDFLQYADMKGWVVEQEGVTCMLHMLELAIESGEKLSTSDVTRVASTLFQLCEDRATQELLNTPRYAKRLVSLRSAFEQLGGHVLPQLLHSLNGSQVQARRAREAQIREAIQRATRADGQKWCSRPGCERAEDGSLKLKRCTGCQSVAYCSKECQARHWKSGHKHKCMTRKTITL